MTRYLLALRPVALRPVALRPLALRPFAPRLLGLVAACHLRAVCAVFVVLTLFAGPSPVQAHGGEDHGPAPSAMTTRLLPRAVAHSDELELVAVLEPDRLLLFIDHAATNEPLAQASVELDGALGSGRAVELSPGLYAVSLNRKLAAGTHPLTFTVQGGEVADLLSAELVLHADAAAPDAREPGAWSDRLRWAAVGAAVGATVVMALGVSAGWLRRKA